MCECVGVRVRVLRVHCVGAYVSAYACVWVKTYACALAGAQWEERRAFMSLVVLPLFTALASVPCLRLDDALAQLQRNLAEVTARIVPPPPPPPC